MESSVLNFQSVSQSLIFKTFYHNQTQQFGYDDLFLNQRVIIFSVPNTFTPKSFRTLKDFNSATLSGIDSIYCVSSSTQLIGPWVDKHAKNIIGLYDTGEFVKEIAEYGNIDKNLQDLKNYWQYFVIVDNGKIEKLWHNPIKDHMLLTVIKNPKYGYHNLTVGMVKEYLASK